MGLDVAAIALIGLYLPRAPSPLRAPRRRWKMVEREIRLADCAVGAVPTVLSRAGLWLEAGLLGEPGVLAIAEQIHVAGRALTPVHASYPARWLQILGHAAPPALWIAGKMPSAPFITIVGSRHVSESTFLTAFLMGRTAVERGYSVLSGGAAGCDRAAAQGALEAAANAGEELCPVEVVPYGLDQASRFCSCTLSLAAPSQPFSTALAMERNALLYAASERGIVVTARFRAGGTWIGATEALRRRLTSLFVLDEGSEAARALASLGAYAISEIDEVFAAKLVEPSRLNFA